MDYKKTQLSLFGLLTALLLTACNAQAAVGNASTLMENQDKLLFAQALMLSTQQQWPEAESIYRDLIARNKEWPEPKNNLAILLLKTNRLDEAKLMLEDAVISSPSYRVAQKNRTQLYNFLATQAYGKALGDQQLLAFPEMDYIEHIYQPVKVVEKVVEKIVDRVVEKVVEKRVEVFVEQSPIVTADENQLTKEVVADRIEKQLLGWSRAWAQGDFGHYIKSYSENFVPSDQRKNYADWRNIRKAKLKYGKGVKVMLDDVRVFVEESAEHALVEFVQHYESKNYSDKTLKQLYMQKGQNNWLILSERVIKTF